MWVITSNIMGTLFLKTKSIFSIRDKISVSFINVLRGDETITLGFSNFLVKDYEVFLRLVIGKEEVVKAFVDGVPT